MRPHPSAGADAVDYLVELRAEERLLANGFGGRRGRESAMATRNKIHSVLVTGRLEPASRTVVITTDGACNDHVLGAGWLSTSGHYGYRAHGYAPWMSGVHRAAISELRAVYWGLDHVLSHHDGPVTVRCDSEQALGYLRNWSRGSGDLPDGYSLQIRYQGKPPTLVALRELVLCTGNLTFRHVKGHMGDPLNEAADALAKLGSRVSRGVVKSEIGERLAKQWAQTGLEDWKSASRAQ